jgi:hypothetical protein
LTAVRVGMAGAAALVVGGALLGTSLAASAASPTLSISPNMVTSTGIVGIVPTGTGYPSSATGAGLICPIVTGEPTVVLGSLGSWPVGCETFGLNSKANGSLKPTSFPLVSGKVIAQWGPTTMDSAGHLANTDALNFPVPPYVDEHGSVEVYATFGSSATEQGSATLSFNFNTPGATTTSTSSTTTTTQPCKAESKTASASTGRGTVTVDPATCLVNGTVVSVKATGLTPHDSGSVLECNTDKSQPTMTVLGAKIPVSCSAALAKIFSTGSGSYSTTFTAVEGTPGPPTTGNDSTGKSGAADAALYPCPPTAAEISKGDGCVIAVGDLAIAPSKVGDEIAVPILFNTAKGAKSPPTTATTASSSATTSGGGGTTATTSSATSATSGSLAFTGTGPGVWWLGIIGIMLMILGALMLLLAGPRLVFARAVHTSSRVIRRRN